MGDGLSNAASMAQIIGVDTMELVTKIQQMARTARQNRSDCELLACRMDQLADLLPRLPACPAEADATTERPLVVAVRKTLVVVLGETLVEAHELVLSCQGRTYQFFTSSRRKAQRFRDVGLTINCCIHNFQFISNIRTFRNLDEFMHTDVATSAPWSTAESTIMDHHSGGGLPKDIPFHLSEEIRDGFSNEHKLGSEAFEKVYTESISMDHHSGGVLPKDIPFHLLEEITDGFSNERKLGSGAFGNVYMGMRKDGEKIAVKMLYDMPGLDEVQFINEFNNLSKLQHPNIVRLVGYCYEIRKTCVEHNGRHIFAEKVRMALCFEYMPSGSLDKYLCDEYNGLDWNVRYTIIRGICKGLKYLHEELRPPIYHLDLKPANILLDENMLPKIADFGLSRFYTDEHSKITTSSLGTRGYVPPEYTDRNIISDKFDIFSLGVVIIKIVTGPTGYNRSAEMPPQEFVKLVLKNWRKRLQAKATTRHLLESYSKQVKKCVEIALSSVVADRHKRPTIGDIVRKLEDDTETNSQILTTSSQVM